MVPAGCPHPAEPAAHAITRHRVCDQIALAKMTAQLLERMPLLLGLDSFARHAELLLGGEGHQHLDGAAGLPAVLNPGDEPAVDLEVVERQELHAFEVGEAHPIVVHRDGDAGAAQLVQQGPCDGGIARRFGLSDFQRELARIEALALQQLEDLVGPLPRGEEQRRDIDCHGERHAARLPGDLLADDLLQDVPGQGNDGARPLGLADEAIGLQQSMPRVSPAHERFYAPYPAGFQADDRLIVDYDLVLQDRDRKSTRLNSSHTLTSYAAFSLKKKTTLRTNT